jgi:hypothetical protein
MQLAGTGDDAPRVTHESRKDQTSRLHREKPEGDKVSENHQRAGVRATTSGPHTGIAEHRCGQNDHIEIEERKCCRMQLGPVRQGLAGQGQVPNCQAQSQLREGTGDPSVVRACEHHARGDDVRNRSGQRQTDGEEAQGGQGGPILIEAGQKSQGRTRTLPCSTLRVRQETTSQLIYVGLIASPQAVPCPEPAELAPNAPQLLMYVTPPFGRHLWDSELRMLGNAATELSSQTNSSWRAEGAIKSKRSSASVRGGAQGAATPRAA